MQHFSRPVHFLVKESKLSVTNQLLTTLIANWQDVCGAEYKDMTLPYKIVWAKKQHRQNDDKKQACLHILCPDAFKTKLMYQEAVWLDRINRVVGSPIFNRLQTRHHDDWKPPAATIKSPGRKTRDNGFDDILDAVHDPDLKRSLQRISQAIADTDQ